MNDTKTEPGPKPLEPETQPQSAQGDAETAPGPATLTDEAGASGAETPPEALGELLTVPDRPGDVEVPDPLDQIADLEAKLKDMREKLLRALAELDNVRKRARREADDAVVRGQSEVIRQILPAVDSLDIALKSVDVDASAEGIVEGMRMVRKQFLSALDRFGLKPLDSQGLGFDPNYHEAVAQVESANHPAGQVVEEIRKGYLLGDRLLRAALVVVSKGPPEAAPPEEGAAAEAPVPEVSGDVSEPGSSESDGSGNNPPDSAEN